LIHQFSCEHGAVLSLVAKGEIIAAGCQDGYVKMLDLETKTTIRTIIVQEVCCLALLMTAG
jgi:di- and tripeptidase